MSDDLIKEVNELPNPQRNLLSHNERELIGLCYRLRDAIEATAKQISTIRNQAMKACEWRDDAILKKDARIAELESALKCAKKFIDNGIEVGAIRLPDMKDDPAHKTLPAICAASGEPDINN